MAEAVLGPVRRPVNDTKSKEMEAENRSNSQTFVLVLFLYKAEIFGLKNAIRRVLYNCDRIELLWTLWMNIPITFCFRV